MKNLTGPPAFRAVIGMQDRSEEDARRVDLPQCTRNDRAPIRKGGKTSWNTLIVIGVFICTDGVSFGIDHIFDLLGLGRSVDQYYVAGVAWATAMLGISTLVMLDKRHQLALTFGASPISLFAAIILGVLGANIATAVQATEMQIAPLPWGLWPFVLLVIIAPIVEEVFCRGIILQLLLIRNSTATAIIISTILFALIHPWFWPACVYQLLFTGVYLYFRRSLTASMIAHAVANCAALLPSGVLLYPHYVQHLQH